MAVKDFNNYRFEIIGVEPQNLDGVFAGEFYLGRFWLGHNKASGVGRIKR
jgi:hypothetical protein